MADDVKKRGYPNNLLYWKLTPKNDHLLNSLLVLIAYRCFDGTSYSGKFFELNKSLEIYFGESVRKLSSAFSLLIDNGWIIPVFKKRKSRKREFKLSDKTIKLIFSETELVLKKEVDLENLKDTNFEDIVKSDYVHGKNQLCDIVKSDYVHGKNQPCDMVKNNQLKRTNKRTIKKNSLNGQRESFEENQIEISGGNKFIEAIERTGLMPEFKKIVTQSGRNPEKDTIPLIMDWVSLDNNQSKRFSPEIIIKRFNGAIKNGFIPSANSKQAIPQIAKGGKLI